MPMITNNGVQFVLIITVIILEDVVYGDIAAATVDLT